MMQAIGRPSRRFGSILFGNLPALDEQGLTMSNNNNEIYSGSSVSNVVGYGVVDTTTSSETDASAAATSVLRDHGTTMVTELSDNDVVFGRGAPVLKFVGNQRYRSLIRTNLSSYMSSKNSCKDTIARSILHTIHADRDGRFLRRVTLDELLASGECDSEQASSALVYYKIVPTTVALQKVKQALRDSATLKRHSSASSVPRQKHLTMRTTTAMETTSDSVPVTEECSNKSNNTGHVASKKRAFLPTVNSTELDRKPFTSTSGTPETYFDGKRQHYSSIGNDGSTIAIASNIGVFQKSNRQFDGSESTKAHVPLQSNITSMDNRDNITDARNTTSDYSSESNLASPIKLTRSNQRREVGDKTDIDNMVSVVTTSHLAQRPPPSATMNDCRIRNLPEMEQQQNYNGTASNLQTLSLEFMQQIQLQQHQNQTIVPVNSASSSHNRQTPETSSLATTSTNTTNTSTTTPTSGSGTDLPGPDNILLLSLQGLLEQIFQQQRPSSNTDDRNSMANNPDLIFLSTILSSISGSSALPISQDEGVHQPKLSQLCNTLETNHSNESSRYHANPLHQEDAQSQDENDEIVKEEIQASLLKKTTAESSETEDNSKPAAKLLSFPTLPQPPNASAPTLDGNQQQEQNAIVCYDTLLAQKQATVLRELQDLVMARSQLRCTSASEQDVRAGSVRPKITDLWQKLQTESHPTPFILLADMQEEQQQKK